MSFLLNWLETFPRSPAEHPSGVWLFSCVSVSHTLFLLTLIWVFHKNESKLKKRIIILRSRNLCFSSFLNTWNISRGCRGCVRSTCRCSLMCLVHCCFWVSHLKRFHHDIRLSVLSSSLFLCHTCNFICNAWFNSICGISDISKGLRRDFYLTGLGKSEVRHTDHNIEWLT